MPDNVLMRELDRESAILDLNDEKEYEVEPVTLEEDLEEFVTNLVSRNLLLYEIHSHE